MAAGATAAHGGSMESTITRKFQNITNTMDSIQGLSAWCIENKKYHSVIVRHWIKCLRKSDSPHRLNLFYVANDIIQNCKRKNAIVYRTEFAEVLPEAFVLVNHEGDTKVIKSVDRILSIWEDRGVYTGTLIADLRGSLIKEGSPPDTPVEQKTPQESKADLQSKIVAEFVPQALMDQLSKYKRSLEELDLREKQLAAMRVDICSSDALKKLKDKAGGKKFSKDFEEANTQLQDFVKFFEKQSRTGPALLEALTNADIFYEMQYNEVKIVANAYQTFANRVSHLKRKLDSLKTTLPDLDDSPIPSPSADAPSPTGSESPFHGMESHPDPDLDGSAMEDDLEPPAPSPLSSVGGSPPQTENLGDNDNREVEDMELSEEEMEGVGIIVEQQMEQPANPEESTPAEANKEPSVAVEQPATQVTPPAAAPASTVENVDLGKIGSILNSLSSVIKNSESPPASAPAATPALPVNSQDASSLVNLLSKVDVSPSDLLSALSKVQSQSSFGGVTSAQSKPVPNVSSFSSSADKINHVSTSAPALTSQSVSVSSLAAVSSSYSSSVTQSTNSHVPPQTPNQASALVQALHRDTDSSAESKPSSSSQSLESKIHNFLQGNPAFNAFDLSFSVNPAAGENVSPGTGTDTQDGTPVRDEGGSTPTQDEIMDKPTVVPFSSNTNAPSAVDSFTKATVLYPSSTQINVSGSQEQAQNGQVYPPHPTEDRISTCYQQFSAPTGGPVPGEAAPDLKTSEGFKELNEMSWFSETYPQASAQQHRPYGVTAAGSSGRNQATGLYQYQTEQSQQHQEALPQQSTAQSSGFFSNNLPPVPKLPPPPPSQAFEPLPTRVPANKQMMNSPGEIPGIRTDGAISGLIVHDHQHKSMYAPEDPPFNPDQHHPRYPENLHPQREDMQYHDERYSHDPGNFREDPYQHPEDPYYRQGSPPRPFPRGHGMHPGLSPSEEPFYTNDYQQQNPPQHFMPRRPLPPPRPHLEPHHPGLRPPRMPLHPGLHPPPRGPPRAPFPPHFHGPSAMLRGKRPGPPSVPRGGLGGGGIGGNPGPMFPPKRPFLPPRY